MPAAEGPVVTPALGTAGTLHRRGQIREALTTLTMLRPEDLDEGDRAIRLAYLVDCRLARGELADAMSLGAELAAYLDLPGLPGAAAHHAQGEICAAFGENDAAVEHFTGAGDLVDDSAECLERVPWRAGAALALVRAGRRREASDLTDAHLEVALVSGSRYAVAQSLRAMGTAHPGGERLTILRQARAAVAGTGAERLAAQIDTDLAGLLLLDSSEAAATEALVLLRGAEEYAGREELWPLQCRVRRLLERAGAVPRKLQSEALAALTASERRVARLAADGLTNRQIADELVVTVKAVEWHLSHVYRKLGISSRTHLAGTLGVPA
jgi:ATP/maltotriose-dependent transcriptional regulator MalT